MLFRRFTEFSAWLSVMNVSIIFFLYFLWLNKKLIMLWLS